MLCELCSGINIMSLSMLTKVYLKVSVNVLWNNMFRLGFVLAVHDVHVQPPLLELEANTEWQLKEWDNSFYCKNFKYDGLQLKQKRWRIIKERVLTCLMNNGASLSGSSKHFSSSPRKKLQSNNSHMFSGPILLFFVICYDVSADSRHFFGSLYWTCWLNKMNILFVPVIDLMDVPKDDFIFSPHVVRNALFFHSTYVALTGGKRFCKTRGEKKGLTPGCTKNKNFFVLPLPLIRDLWRNPSRSLPAPEARNYGDANRMNLVHSAVRDRGMTKTRRLRTHCLLLRKSALRSSISSMGEEEERRELSEGFKDGELLSPCSTDRELGRSSRDWRGRGTMKEKKAKNCWNIWGICFELQ